MIEAGSAATMGAVLIDDGVNFAVYSSTAEAIDLCLFENGIETARLALPGRSGDVWHGWVKDCKPGQAYGFRVHGGYVPENGIRSNPDKLLLDPYARCLDGKFSWSSAVFDYVRPASSRFVRSSEDSSPHVPKCIVTGEMDRRPDHRPQIPWRKTIIYETNVRGYTMQHPGLSAAERGRFRGMANGEILEYLSALGITSVELMPVFEFIDEQHLFEKGLKNLWGYNSINFFTPARRYLGRDDAPYFREMVDSIHAAGIEVILDVAYNHTGEGDRFGPTLSFRGLDNRSYYRLDASDPSVYLDDTGCGNTLDADQPVVQALIIDSLRYWSDEMGVDGFRFDLATVLARSRDGFRTGHPLLRAIAKDPKLAQLKLIAEPWDVGPDGYQLGNFPPGWGEWNDQFRDDVRRFWRGDDNSAPNLAKRLHGSADRFDNNGRGPTASINFVTSHDGFTLADLVSYASRHNQANGEENQDGHRHNFSDNFGAEGDTDDPRILNSRRQRRLNLLATLLFSQGTPMLLGGDEFGNSQQGNNNAYAQDNPIGWIDWSGLAEDPSFVAAVRELIRIRNVSPLLRQGVYRHGDQPGSGDRPDIAWYLPDGRELKGDEWDRVATFGVVLSEPGSTAIAILINADHSAVWFRLPILPGENWQVAFDGQDSIDSQPADGSWKISGSSVTCLVNSGDVVAQRSGT